MFNPDAIYNENPEPTETVNADDYPFIDEESDVDVLFAPVTKEQALEEFYNRG